MRKNKEYFLIVLIILVILITIGLNWSTSINGEIKLTKSAKIWDLSRSTRYFSSSINHPNPLFVLPTVIGTYYLGNNEFIIVQKPDKEYLSNIIVMEYNLNDYNINNLDSIQYSIIENKPRLKKSYELDTAIWIYNEGNKYIKGPFNYAEINTKYKVNLRKIILDNQW